jgi:hypothetical protein
MIAASRRRPSGTLLTSKIKQSLRVLPGLSGAVRPLGGDAQANITSGARGHQLGLLS